MTDEMTRNDSVTVGATAVLLFDDANPNRPRTFLYIRNSSAAAQILTLSFGDLQAPTANKGIVLTPTGAYYEAQSENFVVWQGRIWGICDAAAGTVSVVERS